MDKRKRFERTCSGCGKVEIVRSDQLSKTCVSCRTKISSTFLVAWHKENPEAAGNASRKHGMHKTRLYRIHKSMMDRCGHNGTRHKWAMYYSDRGIHVCSDWHNRECFFDWAKSNGYQDDLELDRIDNSRGYEPNNCRWVTHKENQNNRTNSRSVRWSFHSNSCVNCGTTTKPHVAKSLCSPCYQRAIYNPSAAKKPSP
jgi:hypothetical protein